MISAIWKHQSQGLRVQSPFDTHQELFCMGNLIFSANGVGWFCTRFVTHDQEFSFQTFESNDVLTTPTSRKMFAAVETLQVPSAWID